MNRDMIAGAALTLAMVVPPVLADTRTRADQRERDVMALARVCLHEAGWEPGDDCAGILSALRNRQATLGMRTLASMAHTYSGRVFDKGRTDRRAWIPWVEDTEAEPKHWPANVSWPTHREKWAAIVELAGVLIDRPSECPGAHAWGGRFAADMERPLRLGWVEVDCSRGDEPTRNAFWTWQ